MQNSQIKRLIKAFGAETRVAWARWAPSSDATQTLAEAHGISSITRTGSLAELIALANELRTDYTAHLAQRVHPVNDATNTIETADATDEASAITLANVIKANYGAHLSQDTVHAVNDATNTVAAADATDTASLYTLLNELKDDFNAHRTQATVHSIDDDKNVISADDATTEGTAVALANELKADINLHFVQLAHTTVDATNVLTASAASDLPTAITLLNQIRSAYAAHRVDTDHHPVADATNTVASSACTNRETAVTLANQLKTAFVAHRTQATVHETNDDANNVAAVLAVAGCYRLNLTDKFRAAMVLLSYVENDTTHYHFVEPTALTPLERTIDIRHRSVAYASAADGPAASDTVDELQVVVFLAPNAVKGTGAMSKLLRAYGPKCEIAYVRWAPSADDTQTLTEAFGVSGVERTGAGAYTINLARKCKALVAIPFTIENDTTNYHWTEVTATSASDGTVTMRHRTSTYANVAAGAPTASDTVDGLECLILMRVADGTTAGATDSGLLHDVYCYGPAPFLARVRWAPSGDTVQALTEAPGFASVSRTGAGAYTANLMPNGIKALAACAYHRENDVTNYHWTEVTATSASARTITVRHRTQVFADVASAPTASDTVDELEVFALCRCSS